MSTGFTAHEIQRIRNIENNRALLEEVSTVARKVAPRPDKTAKPIQSTKEKKRKLEEVENAPRRHSTRLRRGAADPNESPSKRKKREEEEEARRQEEEKERIAQEERELIARLPRHDDLDLAKLGADEQTPEEHEALLSTLRGASKTDFTGSGDASTSYSDDRHDQSLIELKKQFKNMAIVSRAKVTLDRVYSAVFHADRTKDLIFFGDKHGQLGIWDARAPTEDGDESADKEGGKIYRLQPHWPATSKSSICSLKLDPLDSHGLYTLSYDSTLRKLSYETGVSTELLSWSNRTLPSSMDFEPGSPVIWISDQDGRVTRVDTRAPKYEVQRWRLSSVKIGCVSVNPTNPSAILCASNDRTMKIWDARKLDQIPLEAIAPSDIESKGKGLSLLEYDEEGLLHDDPTEGDAGILRGHWKHDKSVSSAYWSPTGNRVVSTSYDDHVRIWKFSPTDLAGSGVGKLPSMRPSKVISHNCQTGKWLTILRAQWNPSRDFAPHFTIANMNHALDIYSEAGELIARLSDRTKVTAVQAVTCSSPTTITRIATGNGSGRCVLWDVVADA